MDIKEEKREIRKKIRTLKGEQSQAEKEAASLKIAEKLLGLKKYHLLTQSFSTILFPTKC